MPVSQIWERETNRFQGIPGQQVQLSSVLSKKEKTRFKIKTEEGIEEDLGWQSQTTKHAHMGLPTRQKRSIY